MGPHVPTIDLTPWRHGEAAARERVAAAVDDACRVTGFLQVVGHGVPEPVVAAVYETADAFFARPLSEKLPWRSSSPDVDRGYSPVGSEGLAYSVGIESAPDLFEAFNIGAETVDLSHPAVAAERHRMLAPNIWPEGADELRAALVRYFDAARDVAHLMTAVFAAALGLADGYFEPFTSHSTDVLRVNHYERRAGDPPPVPGQLRMGAHTDYGIVTVLAADPVPGLQIVGPDGEWHDVVPEPGAFLVNLGDLLAEWTNDRWRSTVHRVVPPAGDGPALRRSAAFFHDGNHDALVACLPTCVSADDPARYAPVRAGDHLLAKLVGPRTLSKSDAMSTASDRLVTTASE